MKRLAYILFSLLFPLLALSQQYYIKGQVRDDGGTPMQNVTMLLHSSGYLYKSGSDGGFGIMTPMKVDTLTIFREGYQKEKRIIWASKFNDIVLKKVTVVKSIAPSRLVSFTQNLKREEQQRWFAGDETYTSTVENNFINASAYPKTGVSLNVDRASYSNVRRFLTMNSTVPPDAVRIEEMLNYFNLEYKEPPGDKPFEIATTLTACPWNKNNQLLFAHINSKKLPLDKVPQTHLVFLIDVSGSMDMPNRLPLLKSGFKGLVNNLRAKDSVSIVVYGGTVGVALLPTSGAEKEKIFKVIDSLQPGGSTPGESGIKLAYSMARNHYLKDGNNRVILATDGDFNVGLRKEEDLEEMIIAQRNAGIYLTCLGIGMGNYKDSKIQTLAQSGNGNFAYIDSYREAEKVLMKEFMQTLYTVADNAFLSVQFNPQYVKQYRLIGFDNKVGALKDTSAVIEGGEVGSAYSMIVAFEIVPVEGYQKSLTDPVNFLLRFQNTANHTACEMSEQPQLFFTPFNQLASPYKFASAVIMFGSLLRGSKYVKDVSWTEILNTAKPAADVNNFSQKEFLELVELAKKLYGKKRKKEE
ncbi:vWA domain-containing protein [Flavisolibacter ginsenosidimutans]|uniref:VWA domain-containing protein n=1 Tax=Flavisolibacter ginsenosidimutans TaxID=661481 RepID=A0A5B8UJD6_9BACT|nr:VWA domain-containing protein [Flavisolibacter ginsenosidimutans]QEC56512.1 VWA domain-containing protein [Flavisolibacter ginsenosidimutans]